MALVEAEDGAWQIGAMNPNKFSCVVLVDPSMNGGENVVADWFDNSDISCPVWMFHGGKDELRFASNNGQNI